MPDNNVVPIVDLKKLYIAILTQDTDTTTFDTPIYLPGVKEISIKPKVTSDDFYAEGVLWLSETTLANVAVEVNTTDLTNENEAKLLGHKIAAEGGIIKSASDKAPEVAILFEADRGGGKGSRFVALYRGVFSLSDEAYKGKEGKSNFQTKKIKATFAPLHSNEMWSYKVDEDEGMTAEKFFASVIMPTVKTEAVEDEG